MSATVTIPMTVVTESTSVNNSPAVVKVACGEEIRRVPLEARTIEVGFFMSLKAFKIYIFSVIGKH